MELWDLLYVVVDLTAILAPIALAALAVSDFQARRRRTAESARISQRSQQADEQLEQALAELNRRVGVEHEPDEELRDESLVLAKLWAAVTGRLNKYHREAQDQGRRAFNAAMSATWIGFTLLVASGIAVATVQNTAGAVVTGVLGGVSATVAGYIARTFLRTYEKTSDHLRGYFLHPVEMSRYLSAERLVAQSGLSEDVQAELMRVLVHSMVTGTLAEASKPSANRSDGSPGRS